jgi:hypothetical protein
MLNVDARLAQDALGVLPRKRFAAPDMEMYPVTIELDFKDVSV